MATLAQLQQRVLDNVYSAEPQSRPALQRLNGAVADQDTDTTVAVDDGSGIVQGDIIESVETGEQGLVWAVSTNDLTVVRAQNGTTSEAWTDDTFVKINPIHTLKQIEDAIDEALRDMDAQGLYQLAAGTDITLASGTDLYELTETDVRNPEGVRAVFYQESTNSDLVGLPFFNVWDPLSQELTKDLGVRLLHWGNKASGDSVSVIYAQSLPDADVGNITEGILEDAMVAYATGKLLRASENARQHDPGRYTDRTVQPGTSLRTGAFWQAEYQRHLWKAKTWLRRQERDLPKHPKQNRAMRFVR